MNRWVDIAKSKLREGSSHIISALQRADEIGGDIRDYVQDRIARSDRAQDVIARFKNMRHSGEAAPDMARGQKQPQTSPATATQATHTTPAPDTTYDGFGDPSIAAQIYGKSSCPWTGRAIRLLEDKQLDYDFVDLDEPENASHQDKLIPATKQNTVPYVFLRGEFVGGFNALNEIARLGQLEYLSMSQEERKSANPQMKHVKVIPRPNTDETAPAE